MFPNFYCSLGKECVSSSHSIGKIRSVINTGYFKRIEAVNFALQYVMCVSRDLSKADIILIGVSRCKDTYLFISCNAVWDKGCKLSNNTRGLS